MGFGTWLAAMMAPLAARLMVAMGFSVVSFVGVTVTLDLLRTQFVQSMQVLPTAALDLAMLAGAGQAMGIIFGAIATRVLMWQISSGTAVLGRSVGGA